MTNPLGRGLEHVPPNSRPRPTPGTIGAPAEDLSAINAKLDDARRALWQGDLRTAEHGVEQALRGLSSGKRWASGADTGARSAEASAHSLLGQILAERGGLTEIVRDTLGRAVDVFRLITSPDTQSGAQVYADYGAALHLLGADDDAVRMLQQAVDLGDTSPHSARLLAGLLLDRGKPERARSLLASVRTTAPGDVEILALLGRADRELGDLDAAGRHLREAAAAARYDGDLTRAANLYDELVELVPGDADLLCARGDVLLHLGKPIDEVVAAFDRALDVDPGHGPAKVGKADALRVRGEFEAALLLLDEVPDPSAEVLALRGDLLRLLGRHEEALAVLDTAVELAPSTAWIVGTRGQTRRALGLLPGAREDLERAVEADRGLAWAWAELAATILALGDVEAADAAADRALELDEEIPLALAVRARSLVDAGEYGAAVQPLERLRDKVPDLGWVWTDLAEAYHQTGAGRAAHAVADQAVDRGVAEPAVRLLHAELLAAEGDETRDAVLADLAAYLASDPPGAAGLHRAGLVYTATGDHDSAADVLGRALRREDLPELRRDTAAAEFAAGRYDAVVETLGALPTSMLTAADLWRLGEAARKATEPDPLEANRSFKLALSADPGYLPALNGLVRVNLDLGKVDRARRYAEKAVARGPDDPTTLVRAAEVELASLDYETALRHLERALTLAPDDRATLLVHAGALLDTARFADALALLDRPELAADPEATVLLGFALENVAALAVTRDRPEPAEETLAYLVRARAVYRACVDGGAMTLFLRRGLADTSFVLGDRVEADAVYHAIVDEIGRSDSYDGDMLGVLGWCYCRLGRYDEAIRTYVSALSAGFGSPNTIYLEFDLALATLASGRDDLGLAEYERAWGLCAAVSWPRRRGLLQVARNDLVQTLVGGGFAATDGPWRIVAHIDEMVGKQ